MTELSAAAAAALGVPEAIVQRSAAARAAETGMSVDDVLAAWAGGGSVAPGSPPPPEHPAEETTTAAEETPSETPAPATPETAPAPAAAAAAAQTVTRSPGPTGVTAAEAAGIPEVITVPTAGIRERTNFAIPKWLAAVLVIIPAFALFSLGPSATGTCGSATQLKTDVVTGKIVNCDGSAFTGSGAGGGGTDYIAEGDAIFHAAPGNCASCHGADGGGGVGPALSGVLTTFGACSDHEEWVTLGSQGTKNAGHDTYGDSGKTINGGMPTFGDKLTDEQLKSVVSFERVRFGGADPAQTLIDCGLVEAAPAGSDTTTSTAATASG